MLEIRIRDTGVGIAEDRQSAIFEDFGQADETISRRFGGTGLGPQHQPPADRADAAAASPSQSKPGEGTTVTLYAAVPAGGHRTGSERRAGACGRADWACHPAGRVRCCWSRISPMNQELIVAMLARMGHTAPSSLPMARKRSRCLERHDAGTADLAGADGRADAGDGRDRRDARAIRERAGRSAKLADRRADRQCLQRRRRRACAAGMNDHLAKPFTIADWSGWSSKWAQRGARRAAGSVAWPPQAARIAAIRT